MRSPLGRPFGHLGRPFGHVVAGSKACYMVNLETRVGLRLLGRAGMHRTLEDWSSAHLSLNGLAPRQTHIRAHFLGAGRDAALRWRGFGGLAAIAILLFAAAAFFA